MIRNIFIFSLCLSLIFGASCSEGESMDSRVPIDLGDAGDFDDIAGPENWEAVPVDLDSYLADAPEPGGYARVYEVTDTDDLIAGDAATGQVGDYILENDDVRFVVEADTRHMSPCPWGGNVIDAEYRSPDFQNDVFGEVCLFLNADQTFKPERYEIIDDGTDSAALLAVTGRTEILDFINLQAMIGFFVPFLADRFELRPDNLFPLRITKYFVLRPGDRSLRVLTRIHNEGDEPLNLVAAYLLLGGGDAAFYNPLSSMGGFGFERLGLANANPDPLPFMAVIGDGGGTAYVPTPDDGLDADLPVAGSYITLFNIVAIVLGRTDVLGTLMASEDELADMSGLLNVEPDEIVELDHRIYATDGDLSTMVDSIYSDLGVETGGLEGVVRDDTGTPLEQARVTAIDEKGRAINQALTDEQGHYAMDLPSGSYEIRARREGQPTITPAAVEITAGQLRTADPIEVYVPGHVEISVRTPDGEPTPARVSLICADDCASKPQANEEDVTFHGLPDDFADVQWVGVSGDLTFPVAPGEYHLVVSRGMEWSIWPYDATDTGGAHIEVLPGNSIEIDAEIARVVDTANALSADFHVHAISSMDSTTPEKDRVLTFLTEGVDVIVSSDHDVIADYGPAAAALGADGELVTLVGTEVTTSVLGHFNGFPLVRDPDSRDGGALDWGARSGPALSPAEIFEWIRQHPGEQVVQLNHPDVSFLAYSDVLRGLTYGDPDRLRVKASPLDPDTGAIDLWSDDFSAMEILNGHDLDRFWGITRWWLTLLGRGQRQTATAVTDTHTRYGNSLGGVPRTFVFVDEAHDDPTTFDTAHFVESVNEQRVIGTNGPYVEVLARNHQGDVAGLGDTLFVDGEPVTFEIDVQIPEWIDVDRLEIFMNSDDVITEAGDFDTDPIPPTETIDLEFSDGDLVVVATGEHEHRRHHKQIEVELQSEVDAYVVFVFHGSESMYPVVADTAARPLAFSNPIYLDADGQGYNSPHLAALAETPPTQPGLRRLEGPSPFEDRKLTPELLEEAFRQSDARICAH